MGTLTSKGIEKQAQGFMDSIHHGQFKDDGVVVDNVPIYKKERVLDTIRIYLFIGLEYLGVISEIKLIDKDGEAVAVSTEILQKPASKGTYITFKYKYVEEVAIIA